MKIVYALAAFLAVTGCSVRPARTQVEVHETAPDRWRVTIQHVESSNAFVFPQSRRPFRTTRWSIVEPRDAHWQEMGGLDAIVADKPFTKIIVDFFSDFSLLEKDYRLNVPFTDGSRLLYTGHLRTRRPEQSPTPAHDFTFKTYPDRPIRILERSGIGRLSWEAAADETYVYFGPISPESNPRMTLIVDPGLPEWIERQMRDLIPHQIDYFANKTGGELPFQPLIVVSYGGSRGSGRTFSAGGLQGMLEIGISGDQWMPKTRDAERYWFRHLAHEIYHLWGAQANRHAEEAEWLSEASAEYASLLAALDEGVFDDPAVNQFIVDAANACVARLGTTPLRESLGPGQSRNVYTCGVVSQKVVDAAARRAGSDIWQVWRRTYQASRPYTTAHFVDAVRGITGETQTAEFIEELAVHGLSGDAPVRITEYLRASGMNVSVSGGAIRLLE
jgi:hypothetical protein